MNCYETIMIFKPEDGKTIKKYVNNIKEYFKENITSHAHIELLGEKKLAYTIKDCKTGVYLLLQYNTIDVNRDEIDRYLHTQDHILKFITVKMDELDVSEFEEIVIEQEDAAASAPDNITDVIDTLDVLLGRVSIEKYKEVMNNEKTHQMCS